MTEPLAINAQDPIEEQYRQQVPAYFRKLQLNFLDGNSSDRKLEAVTKIPSHIATLDMKNEPFDAKLLQLLKAIPAHITSLELPEIDSPYSFKAALSQEEISAFLAAIPNHITSLYLGSLLDGTSSIKTLSPLPAKLKYLNLASSNVGFNTDSETFFESHPNELESIDFNCNSITAKAFKKLKASVHFLNMSSFHIDEKTAEACKEIVASLPASLIRLELTSNQLDNKGIDGLKSIFNELPKQLTTLELGSNNLHSLGTAGLIDVLKSIPKQVTKIDLEHNGLDALDLAQLFQELPLNFQTLGLCYNDLGLLRCDVLINALKKIPDHVTTLDLSWSVLDCTKGELVNVIKAIPATVRSLKLGHNRFNSTTDYEQLFKALPKNLTSLSLAGNDFHNCPAASLATAFKALPKGLVSLDLSNCNLDFLSIDDLITALDGIPDSLEGGLRELTIGKNDKDPQRYSLADLSKLRQYLSTKNFFINGIGSDIQASTISALDEHMPSVVRDLVLDYLAQDGDVVPGTSRPIVKPAQTHPSSQGGAPILQASFLLQVLSHHALTALSAVLMLVGIGAILGGFVLAGAVSLTLGTGLLAAGFFARHRLASLAEPV